GARGRPARRGRDDGPGLAEGRGRKGGGRGARGAARLAAAPRGARGPGGAGYKCATRAWLRPPTVHAGLADPATNERRAPGSGHPRCTPASRTPLQMRRDERGIALIVVLLVMAIVGIVGAEFAYSMRLEASAVRAYKAGIVANHL